MFNKTHNNYNEVEYYQYFPHLLHQIADVDFHLSVNIWFTYAWQVNMWTVRN